MLDGRTLRGALLGLACAAACWLLAHTAWLRGVENGAQDNAFLVRGRRSSAANVVIVALDEPSMQALDKPLVYLSPELAKVVDFLHRQGASAVGIDVLLPQSVEAIEGLDVGGPGDAETLGIAAASAGNVTLPVLLVPGGPTVRPAGQWAPAGPSPWTSLGYVNLGADDDTYVRRQQLRAADPGGAVYPAFALALLGLMEHKPDDWFLQASLDLDGRPVPLDSEGLMRINYAGPPGSIDTVSFASVLSAAEGRGGPDRDWQGAAVLIGLPASTQQDRHATPYLGGSAFGPLRAALARRTGPMSGVEVHANVLATLADRAFITTPAWLSTPVTLALTGLLLGVVYGRTGLEWGAAVAFLHHFAWQALAIGAFCGAGWRVEVAPVLLLGVAAYGVTFAMRWRWMRRMFGTFKSEAVARALEVNPRTSAERQITVLFCDVRGFTPFSERRAPADVVRLLDEFFAAVVPQVEAQGGVVNQYLGDAVMALFGAPAAQPDHALRAVRAAVAVLQEIRRRKARFAGLGAEDFRVGVGVHTGTAIVGIIGSPGRLDYTAIGDTVNTAARIESGNKELGSECLVSRATWAAVPPEARASLAAAWRPAVLAVKGKEQPVEVFEIVVRAEPGTQ